MKTEVSLRALCASLFAASIVVAGTATAQADWAQTLGIGQKSSNLGNATTATSDDYDAFYTNPAGAANFDRPFVGSGIKTFDTRTLSVKQSDAQSVSGPLAEQPANGLDVSPENTINGDPLGIIPSAGGYMPLPSMPNVVIGLGVGTPFLVSADYGNDDATGNFTKFNTTNAALVVVETSPTVGVKVNEELNVGASLGVTTFKYLRLDNALGQSSDINIPGVSLPGLGTTSVGSASLETDDDFSLPVPPYGFATAPTSLSYTLGMQYKVTPKLTLGLTYRSETEETFEGDANVNLSILGTDLGEFNDRFKYEMELPRHLQVGFAYDVSPIWRVMADVRWTNWSDAKGFGSPTQITFENGTIDPLGDLTGGLLGEPLDTLTVNYAAEDAYSFHFGTAYKITPQLELQAGYIYDQSFMPNEAVDLVTLSSDRHIFSLGGTYTKPTSDGEWAFTLGGQLVMYEDRSIAAGQSQTLGGAADTIGTGLSGQLEFDENELGGIDIGGYVWSVGASVSYKFGGGAAPLEAYEPPLEPLK